MQRYGVSDKDKILDAEGENSSRHIAQVHADRRRRLLHQAPDATLDLHGLTQEQAWAALESFFADCRDRDFEKIQIIHGKGNHSRTDNGLPSEPVLKEMVQKFIENCPWAGESGHADAAGGGTGTTWVLLKSTVHDR
jgi:DNA-nicking Smr family endonuclease